MFFIALQGINVVFLGRCAEWMLNVSQLRVKPAATLPAAEQPAALRAAVRQLCELPHIEGCKYGSMGNTYWGQECGDGCEEGEDGWELGTVTVHLPRWAWSADMLRAYPLYAAALNEKSMELDDDAFRVSELTVELLGAAIEVAQQLPSLSLGSLALQSDEHAGVAWPWQELSLGEANVAQLPRLPDPAGPGAPRTVSCAQLVIGSDVLQVRLHACRQQLCTHTHTHTHQLTGTHGKYTTPACLVHSCLCVRKSFTALIVPLPLLCRWALRAFISACNTSCGEARTKADRT